MSNQADLEPTSLRVGGVPEHFNLPWRRGVERGVFADAGLDVTWVDEPSGTGALTAAVGNGDLDVALVLTEGAVSAIGNGLDARIVGTWVASALHWGVHVAASSAITSWGDLGGEGQRFAISRFGSGSHLMAHVLASERGFELSDDDFVIVNNIDGAERALLAGEADVFLWERAMTAPLVRAGSFRRIGIQPTPWPCFVAIAKPELAQRAGAGVRTALRLASAEAAALLDLPDVATRIEERYELHAEDVAGWLEGVRWAADPLYVSDDMLMTVQDRVARLDLVPARLSLTELRAPLL